MKKLLIPILLCLVALCTLQYCSTLSLSQPPHIKSTQLDSSPNPKQTSAANTFPWGIILLSGISATLVTIAITQLLSYFDNKKKRHALIIGFAYELVLAYHRCVIYYMQSLKTIAGSVELSYSRLFDYTDISLLATYAIAKPKPDIVAAIAYLKAVYFQIARQVEDAANYAAAAAEEEDLTIQNNYTAKAVRARESALAFFLASYYPKIHEDIQNKTLEIINQTSNAQQKHLLRIFDKAKEIKEKLDSIAQNPDTSTPEELEKLNEALNKCLVAASNENVDQTKEIT